MLEMNKLYQGDAFDYLKEIPDESIDLIMTDIPYGEVNRESNGLRKLDKEEADICEFDIELLADELSRISKGSIYVFCGIEQISTLKKSFIEKGMSVRLGIWEKSNPSPMNGEHIWLSGIECCIFAKKSGATFREHCKCPVWRFPCGSSNIHPTQKPVELIQYLISVSSLQGDVVLDPFLGSGTTAVAAIRLDRKYIGIEKTEKYFNLAKQRITDEESQLNFFGQAAL